MAKNRLKLFELKEQQYENQAIGPQTYITEEEDSQDTYEEIDNISIKQTKTGNAYSVFGKNTINSSNAAAAGVQKPSSRQRKCPVVKTTETILPQRVSSVGKWKVLSLLALIVIITLTVALVTVLTLMLSSKVTPCTHQPCLKQGQCIVVNNNYICICTEGYSGNTCQDDRCTRSPCLNNGTCLSNGDRYNCSCSKGYYGDRCENEGTFIKTIQSPGFPSNYTNLLNKTWTVNVGRGYVAVLRFKNFSTEYGYDYVTVYNGASASSNLLYKWSGIKVPTDMETTGPNVAVQMTTDQLLNQTGFSADVYKIKR